MNNHNRNYVKIIKEICAQNDINITSYCNDWTFMLEKDGRRTCIIGYTFDLDGGAAQALCRDKCAACAVLKSFDIPCVEHYFVMTPREPEYASEGCGKSKINELLKKYGRIVCKDNEGNGGKNIFCVSSEPELEHATYEIFSNSRGMAVCPYVEIDTEYRLIILDGAIRLVYSKERPYIEGDGEKTIKQLFFDAADRDIKIFKYADVLKKGQYVPQRGQKIYLNWKHNLGLGAQARQVDINECGEDLPELAKKTAEALRLRFASIDIIKEKVSGDYKILEINSGVMMEHFAAQSDRNYLTAKEIYKDAVLTALCCK